MENVFSYRKKKLIIKDTAKNFEGILKNTLDCTMCVKNWRSIFRID